MTEKEILKQLGKILDEKTKNLSTKDDILSLKLDIGDLKEEVEANTEITQETRILVDKALKYAKDAKDETVILDKQVKRLEAKI